MIVINNGQTKAYTVFFPGVLAHGRTFSARMLTSDMNAVNLRILFQVTMICLCVIFRANSSLQNLLGFTILVYAALRISFIKHVRVDLRHEHWSFSLAPASLFMDHFLLYAMYFVAIFVGTEWGAVVPRTFGVLVEILVTGMGLVPVWSYLIYRKRVDMPN